MAEKELVIKLRLDRSQQAQASKEAVADAKKAAQQILSDADVAEQAKIALIKRTNAQRVAEAAKAQKTELELAREAQREADRLAREAARTQTEEARKAAKEAARLANEAARAAEEAEKRKAKAAKDTANEAKRTAVEAARADSEAAKAQQARWNSANDATKGASLGVANFATQMIGLGGVGGAISAIVDHFKQARETAYAAGKMVGDYRDTLLELAALKGQLGDTSTTGAQDIRFRQQTLQTASSSNAYQKAFLNVAQSQIGNQISQKEADKLMVLGGKFQTAEGGAAGTHGQLAGMMPMMMGKKNVSAGEAFAEEQAIYRIMQLGGSDFTPGAEMYMKNAPLVTSGLINDRRLAALQSAFSLTNKGGAGENVQQFARATVGGLGRMRGSGLEVDERQAQYLKRIGATDQMDMIQIGDLISQDFAKQETSMAAQGQKFNALTYLRKHGYQNQEDIMALLQYHGLRQGGQWQNKFLPLTEQQVSPDQAVGDLDSKLQSTPDFLTRKSQLSKEAADIQLGAGKQEYVDAIKGIAFNQLKGEKEVSSEQYGQVKDNWSWGFNELVWGERRKTEERAEEMLENEAERLGVKVDRQYSVNAKTGERTRVYHRDDEYLYGLGRQIQEQGGEIAPGLEGQTRGASDMLEAARLMKSAAEIQLDAAKARGGRAQGAPQGGVPAKVPSRPQVQN